MVDAQAKLAQSLETSTRSVQLLGRAADLSGVPMSQLQQAALALNKRLSEASSGAGPAVKALRALGLEARDLLGLDLDQRFDRINGAIAGLEDPAKKAAVAAALYGDRAYAAITRLDSATLSQAARDVDQFGVALSELQADNIEAANDAMSTLGVVMRGVGNQVAASMAPAITALATGFTDLLREGTPLRAMLDGLGASVSGTFQVMSGTIGRLMSYAGTFASFLAGRFVTSMSLAAASVVTLNAKLLLTRAALMRTGFGALVIGVGELLDRAMSPLSDALGSMFDGLFSGLFGGRASGGGGTVKPIGDLIGKVMEAGSFDGGGRTPLGPRAGGLDGKGGFLAMLHPNESVIDHTRDSGGFGGFGAVRGGDVYVSVQGSNASPEQIAAAVRAESRRQASEIYDRRKRMARAGGAS